MFHEHEHYKFQYNYIIAYVSSLSFVFSIIKSLYRPVHRMIKL